MPKGVSSSKTATGGAGGAPAPPTWIAYWQTRCVRTVNWVHEGSLVLDPREKRRLAGSGAGLALEGRTSVAVSDQGAPTVPDSAR